jgi:hypothetical protein
MSIESEAFFEALVKAAMNYSGKKPGPGMKTTDVRPIVDSIRSAQSVPWSQHNPVLFKRGPTGIKKAVNTIGAFAKTNAKVGLDTVKEFRKIR